MPLDEAGGGDDHARRRRIGDAARLVLDTPDLPCPAPFEKVDTVEGVRLRMNGEGQVLAIMEDVAPEIVTFAARRTQKVFGGRRTEWAYVELQDGLRVYVSASGVVVTRADVNP